MKNQIVNENGEVRSIEGPKAIDAYRIRMLISGMKLEASGMRVSRGVNCRKLAKEITGLKTNDRAALTARLELMLQQRLSECVIVTDGE